MDQSAPFRRFDAPWRFFMREASGLVLASFFVLATQAASKQELPKIVLATGRAGFQSESGKAFYPFGVTYYRPGTGWAPQVWKQWDAEATRKDFLRMKGLGVNCVRVFLSYGSFYSE